MQESLDDLPEDVLIHICAFCGIALYRREVSAFFRGLYIDYDRRDNQCDGWFVLCGECKERVKNAMQGDIEAAVEKRQKIECIDEEDRATR